MPLQFSGLVGMILTWTTLAIFVVAGSSMVRLDPSHDGEDPALRPLYQAAAKFAPLIEKDALVVAVTWNHVNDETGKPQAHDDPALLFWLDRKGFTMAIEEQTEDRLAEFRRRGARYVVCDTSIPFAQTLRSRFRIKDEGAGYLLADVSTPVAP